MNTGTRKHSTHTPLRALRVSDELWAAAQAKAALEGRTVTDVITAALTRYVRTAPRTSRPGRAS